MLAFEASSGVYAKLTSNIAANGFCDRVEAVPKAAMDRDGEISFDIGPAEQTGWGGIAAAGGTGVIVPGVRVDHVLAGQDIAVLKVDVEGGDLLVLRGREQLLREKRIRNIVYESNPERMAELGMKVPDAAAYLAGIGYSTVPIDAHQTEWLAVPA